MKQQGPLERIGHVPIRKAIMKFTMLLYKAPACSAQDGWYPESRDTAPVMCGVFLQPISIFNMASSPYPTR